MSTTTPTGAVSRWFFRPVPLARIAVFRTIAYLFIPIDVFLTTTFVRAHADVPTAWYQPLAVGRLLHLPTPTTTVVRSEEHTSELQSRSDLVCRLLLEI